MGSAVASFLSSYIVFWNDAEVYQVTMYHVEFPYHHIHIFMSLCKIKKIDYVEWLLSYRKCLTYNNFSEDCTILDSKFKKYMHSEDARLAWADYVGSGVQNRTLYGFKWFHHYTTKKLM
jgi:hypothetical protein